MSRVRSRTIGIVGGMGPAATADLFQKIMWATPAHSDQEHLRVVVDSNSQIPDRASYLRGEGPDPSPALVATTQNLVAAGAELVLIACNTAHLFHQAVQAAVPVPVLHVMQETASFLAEAHRGARRIGLLATTGTVASGLYHRALESVGLDVLVPLDLDQAALMAALVAVKRGEREDPARVAAHVAAGLTAKGADVLVAGCTELPLVLSQAAVTVPLIDATQVLAEAAVRRAREGFTHGVEP